jgi:PAS domain-containing protein
LSELNKMPATRQLEVELILTRHLADCLAMPVSIVGVDGEVLHYNEAAAKIAGRPFEEGAMSLDDVASIFKMTDASGAPLEPDGMVTAMALRERRPGHRPLRMCGLDGVWREIELTAFPLEGQGQRLLGAVSIFWEKGSGAPPVASVDASKRAQDVELVLTRQLASSLVMPIWIVGLDGNVNFYNEPAEDILARRFEEAGPMPLNELATMFQATDEEGNQLHTDDLPIAIALKQHRPSHRPMRIQGLDGIWRKIEITAFPLVVRSGRMLGAIALFWEEGPM